MFGILLLTGCATLNPTPYQPAQTNLGNGITLSHTDDVSVSIFKGNSDTYSVDAFNYTVLAAHEDCAKKSQYAFVETPKNYSESSSYTQVSSSTSYHADGRGGYYPVSNTYSYPVTVTSPRFGAAYICKTKSGFIKDRTGELETLSRELVSPITKDFKGGVLIKMKEANAKSPFADGDVITHVSGKRVETVLPFLAAVDNMKAGNSRATAIRNNKLTTVKILIIDQTAVLHKAQAAQHKLVCDSIKKSVDEAASEEEMQPKQGALDACVFVDKFLNSKS